MGGAEMMEQLLTRVATEQAGISPAIAQLGIFVHCDSSLTR